jgi:hypothetical protein
MDPTRADRVKEVEAFPNTRQSKVKHLQQLVLLCGKDELCLTLLAEGLQKLLPPGETLTGLTLEKLQFALLEDKDVRTNCRALQNRRLEAIFKSIAQGKLEPGKCLSS